MTPLVLMFIAYLSMASTAAILLVLSSAERKEIAQLLKKNSSLEQKLYEARCHRDEAYGRIENMTGMKKESQNTKT